MTHHHRITARKPLASIASLPDGVVDLWLSKLLQEHVRVPGINPWSACLFRCHNVEQSLPAVDYKTFTTALRTLCPTRSYSAPPGLRARALLFTLQGR